MAKDDELGYCVQQYLGGRELRLSWRNLIFSRKSAVLAALAALPALSGEIARAQTAPEQRRDAITVEGTVRSAAGESVSDAKVRLEAKDSPAVEEVMSGADGRYTFSSVTPGRYTITAEKGGWRKTSSAVLVLSVAETKQVDLVLEPAAGAVEFDDKPNFIVAGVTDWNNTGVHGSDTNQRTSEELVKATRALEPGEGQASAGREKPGQTEEELREERERVKNMLASTESAEGHRRLGELNERLGKPLEAVREYERAALMAPSEQNYFEWGTELLLHRADQPAVEVFAKGARLHPESARLLAGWGAALFAAGNAEEAAGKLCEAADLKPADAAAYLFLGRMEKSAPGVLPGSEERLARFVRDQPANAMANYYYGIALWKRGRGTAQPAGIEQAERRLRRATEIDPKFGEAFLQLGVLHFAQGNLEQAIHDYRKAIKASPQLSEPHYRLGLAYRRMKEEAKAEQEFRLYEDLTKEETAALEKERRELRQFLIVLKEQPLAPH